MGGCTCIPSKVYQVLYPLKRHFRCAQAQHFLVFCGLLSALIRDPGKGDAQGAPIVPAAHADIWDDVAHDPVGTMGCGSRGVCDVDGHAPCAPASGRWRSLSHRG